MDWRSWHLQGSASLRPIRRPAPDLHRDPPGQVPALRSPGGPSPAAPFHNELPHPRTHPAVPPTSRGLWLPRATDFVTWPQRRPQTHPDRTRSSLRVGRNASTGTRYSAAEGPRESPVGPHWLGPRYRRDRRLHRQRAAAMPASGGPLLRSSQSLSQWRAGRTPG